MSNNLYDFFFGWWPIFGRIFTKIYYFKIYWNHFKFMQLLFYWHFVSFHCNLGCLICFNWISVFFPTEDDQSSPVSQATNMQQPSISSITPSTSNPSNSFSLTAQTQMLGQAYSAESSNFGPIYHSTITHGSYSNPYDRYSKMSPPTHHATTVAYNTGYQPFYAPHQTSHHHHAMIRQNGCIDYVPR